MLDVKPVPGKWEGRLFEVHNMVEKPKLEDAPSKLAIIGRYILTPAVFDCSPQHHRERWANCNSPTASSSC